MTEALLWGLLGGSSTWWRRHGRSRAAWSPTLTGAGGISVTSVAAVFLSNIPESLSSSAVAAGLGYLSVAHSPHEVVGAIKRFRGGGGAHHGGVDHADHRWFPVCRGDRVPG